MRLSLRAARVNARFSQSGLAEKIGVSKSTISRWETGVLPIPENFLSQICDLCGVKKDDLVLLIALRDGEKYFWNYEPDICSSEK